MKKRSLFIPNYSKQCLVAKDIIVSYN